MVKFCFLFCIFKQSNVFKIIMLIDDKKEPHCFGKVERKIKKGLTCQMVFIDRGSSQND